MRLWSLHPQYLDSKGLVALWREGLLAQKVLMGETKGYRHHPQLVRFKAHPYPLKMMGAYLLAVQQEAVQRGYRFDKSKIQEITALPELLSVSDQQLAFEHRHLCQKLQQRDPERLLWVEGVQEIDPHPLFAAVAGEIADWERV